ncbi:MAG: TerB family tellurite resistance protein [Cyclobacteriaceae bacterium]|nr:TerB family tellurite resistance protein [Cyclobacteriaceae bacterium]
MDYKKTLTTLYHLISGADGNINEKELQLGKQLAKLEGIDEAGFLASLETLKSQNAASLLSDCVAALRKMNISQQIRCIAWLCVVANGDGFMDKEEWTLIYKIYHTELGLPMSDIMETQKEINKLIHGKSFQSIGVRVND